MQNHPVYVLQRHISKYEALQPGAVPLGLHRGEPYYSRCGSCCYTGESPTEGATLRISWCLRVLSASPCVCVQLWVCHVVETVGAV